ncbi:MAG: AAA family ATPase [Fibrobacter sp.]|nr:AAA family ATPase [Fibrobacter sp.]
MFKRKILKEFEKWKNGGGKKKALVVKGMRQIGKTSSVLEFAKSHYKHVVYVNFKENDSARKIFDGDFNVNRMTIDLSACYPMHASNLKRPSSFLTRFKNAQTPAQVLNHSWKMVATMSSVRGHS